jgi:hypothetical protein
MPDSLQNLESLRADLVKQIAGLGDLRSGSISEACPLRQTQLSLPPARSTRAWPEPSIDLQRSGQDRDRVASYSRRSEKGRA